MKARPVLLAVCLLAACDGGAAVVGGSSAPSPTATPADPATLNGLTLTRPSTTAVGYTSVAGEGAYSSDITYAFENAGGLDVTEAGYSLHLDWSPSDAAYVGADGPETMQIAIFNDPGTPDVFVFKTTTTVNLNGNSSDSIGYTVSGNLTPGTNVPMTGTASYSGGLEVSGFHTDQMGGPYGGNPQHGTVTFNVDLAANAVAGQLAVQGGQVIGATTFTFNDAVLARSAGSTSFTGTLQSGDVTVTSGQIFGDLMGPTGAEAGGTFYVNTFDTSLAGVFTAKQ